MSEILCNGFVEFVFILLIKRASFQHWFQSQEWKKNRRESGLESRDAEWEQSSDFFNKTGELTKLERAGALPWCINYRLFHHNAGLFLRIISRNYCKTPFITFTVDCLILRQKFKVKLHWTSGSTILTLDRNELSSRCRFRENVLQFYPNITLHRCSPKFHIAIIVANEMCTVRNHDSIPF